MKVLSLIARELSLLGAFIILGALVLISIWVSQNVNNSFLNEFRNDQISVILKTDYLAEFKTFLDQDDLVLNYEVQNSEENKSSIQRIYPELKSVLQPLAADFFPISSTIITKNGPRLLSKVQEKFPVLNAYLLHQAPAGLKSFLTFMNFIFISLWLMALALVLYFQVEHISFRENHRWSLLKMLGAKPSKIFWPLYLRQVARVSIASFFAIAVAYYAALQIRSVFAWDWSLYSVWTWAAFFIVSIVLTGSILLLLFSARYRRVALG